jgi:hypothetical protein
MVMPAAEAGRAMKRIGSSSEFSTRPTLSGPWLIPPVLVLVGMLRNAAFSLGACDSRIVSVPVAQGAALR